MSSEILEHIIKLLIVFIIGVVLIAVGIVIQIIAITVLGGLMAGISLLIMVVGIILDR